MNAGKRMIAMKAGGLPVHRKKLATVIKTIRGNFRTWRKGQRVMAEYTSGVGWCIERIKWIGTLPLMNQCVAVPRSHLSFKNEGQTSRRRPS